MLQRKIIPSLLSRTLFCPLAPSPPLASGLGEQRVWLVGLAGLGWAPRQSPGARGGSRSLASPV
ncbi:hypothetical protein E2C01_038110 [Portunus trituberculatus]|uniref:Uncharacterized protein n=1 Tax=Portunus trituberculatus TaxID=210409 RepID=A0A5B7FFY2_PORTR|nr:hypothetical protein [Portunus trituberculatus]